MDKLTDESQKEYQEIIRRQGTLSDTLEYLTSTIAEYTETSTALHGTLYGLCNLAEDIYKAMLKLDYVKIGEGSQSNEPDQ